MLLRWSSSRVVILVLMVVVVVVVGFLVVATTTRGTGEPVRSQPVDTTFGSWSVDSARTLLHTRAAPALYMEEEED